jgi:hypothetical protein
MIVVGIIIGQLACFAAATKSNNVAIPPLASLVTPLPHGTLRHRLFTESGTLIFHALENIGEIVDFVCSFDTHPQMHENRKLRCLDMFAGSARVASVMGSVGPSKALDVAIGGDSHDVCTHRVWFETLFHICCLVPHGLIMSGPPCKHWIFMSAWKHCRSDTFIFGNCFDERIRLSNILACNFSLLVLIACVRKVWVCIEQPATSKLFKFDLLRRVLAHSTWQHVHTFMRPLGHEIPKATRLWSNLPTLKSMHFAWSPLIEKRIVLASQHEARNSRFTRRVKRTNKSKAGFGHLKPLSKQWQTTKKVAAAHTTSGKWVCGGTSLASSAVYPWGFARALKSCYLAAYDELDDGEKLYSERLCSRSKYLEFVVSNGFMSTEAHLANDLNRGLSFIHASLWDEHLPILAKKARKDEIKNAGQKTLDMFFKKKRSGRLACVASVVCHVMYVFCSVQCMQYVLIICHDICCR